MRGEAHNGGLEAQNGGSILYRPVAADSHQGAGTGSGSASKLDPHQEWHLSDADPPTLLPIIIQWLKLKISQFSPELGYGIRSHN